MSLLALKEQLINKCHSLVDDRIRSQKDELDSLQEAANNETKSSVGDKYESGRAMMHLEKEKVASQLNATVKLRQVLSQIKLSEKTTVGLGSVVRTTDKYFFISVSLGELLIDDVKVICISLASPLGKNLQGCKAGDKVSLNQMNLEIQEVC